MCCWRCWVPLYIPVLIFGAGAVEATVSGLGGQSHLSLLGAILVASLVLAPRARHRGNCGWRKTSELWRFAGV